MHAAPQRTLLHVEQWKGLGKEKKARCVITSLGSVREGILTVHFQRHQRISLFALDSSSSQPGTVAGSPAGRLTTGLNGCTVFG